MPSCWPLRPGRRRFRPTYPPLPLPGRRRAVAGSHGLDVEQTVLAFLTAAVHGQVSVAVRLIPIGQSDGLAIMAALETDIAALARHAAAAGLEDIGTIAYAPISRR